MRLWIGETLTPEVVLKDLREGSVAPMRGDNFMCACRFDDHYQTDAE